MFNDFMAPRPDDTISQKLPSNKGGSIACGRVIDSLMSLPSESGVGKGDSTSLIPRHP